MSWAQLIGAVLRGVSNRSQQRSAERQANQANQANLIQARDMGDEQRRTDMFRSDLTEYERTRERERLRGGLANFLKYGKTPEGQNQWSFMDNYEPTPDMSETPDRPDYADYAHSDATPDSGSLADSLTPRQQRRLERWQRRNARRNGDGG